MSSTTIQVMQDSDAAHCLDLIARSIDKLSENYYDEKQRAAWVAQYPSPEQFATWKNTRAIFSAHCAGDIVGLGEIDLNRCEIVGVYVDPNHTRSGIGEALLEKLEHAALDGGVDDLHIDASLNAVDFYRRCGYVDVEPVEFMFQNGVRIKALSMRKRLGDKGR